MSAKQINKRGFTLLEVLVVVGLFGILVVALTGIFLATLRGNAKTRAMALVRQEGDHVLAVVTRQIRGGKAIKNCYDNLLRVTDAQGNLAEFSCSTSPEGGYLALGEERLTSENVVVNDCAFSCGLTFRQVNIDFTLTNARAGNVAETATARFRTQVTLRGI